MCNLRNYSICYTATTYGVHTSKNKNKRKSLIINTLQLCYNRNKCLDKAHDENTMSSIFFTIFTGKCLCWILFLIKNFKAILLKKMPTQVFSCKYCGICKITCFEEHSASIRCYFGMINLYFSILIYTMFM